MVLVCFCGSHLVRFVVFSKKRLDAMQVDFPYVGNIHAQVR